MASFDIAYPIIADHEGGYQNNPADRGNYNSLGENVGTNWGISAPVYETWIGRPPRESDMRNMSRATAKQIFKARFWDAIQGDRINSQAVANIFFDGAVNHGTTGIKIMQEVLGVSQDGKVGPITLNAINNANPAKLYNDYREARKRFYYYLVDRTPSFSVFLNGWIRRIDSFTELSPAAAATIGGTGLLLLGLLVWYTTK